MAKDALEGETMRKEETESRIGVATEALERADEEAKRRDIEEVLMRAEEEERLEFQRLAADRSPQEDGGRTF